VYRGCSRRSSVSCGGPRKEGLEKFFCGTGKGGGFLFTARGAGTCLLVSPTMVRRQLAWADCHWFLWVRR